MSMSTLYTVKTTTRARSLSLSLIASRPPPILNLPAELVFKILELAITGTKPSVLAAISKSVKAFIDVILYRNVVLDSLRAIDLFHRTVTFNLTAFLATHVRGLAILMWNAKVVSPQAHHKVKDIIAACVGLHTLVLPSSQQPIMIAPPTRDNAHENLSQLTLRTFDGIRQLACTQPSKSNFIESFADISAPLTHLRICEPHNPGAWHSPCAILASFGALPNLSHLQLSRRVNANEANDLVFVNDIRSILISRPKLKMLVVSIFADWSIDMAVGDSDIWKLMYDLCASDRRLVLLPGICGEWKQGWRGTAALAASPGAVDFWSTARIEADKRRMVLKEEGQEAGQA